MHALNRRASRTASDAAPAACRIASSVRADNAREKRGGVPADRPRARGGGERMPPWALAFI
eukprot:364476-Chlamydomonas_euryale.AAC.1